MSTLCRAEWGWQKYGGAETSERPFFCPTHFSAFQKCRVKGCQKISDNWKYFGNISDLFFWGAQPFYRAVLSRRSRNAKVEAARRRTRSLGGASRAALPVKDVFGGTPNTERETHALPIHRALLNDQQGNQTERVRGSHSPDEFSCPRRIRPFFAPFALGDFAFNSRIKNPTPSHRVAVSRSDFVKSPVKAPRPITEKVKVIHNERTLKVVKWFFLPFFDWKLLPPNSFQRLSIE